MAIAFVDSLEVDVMPVERIDEIGMEKELH